MEASITVKIKGVTKSQLQDRAKRDEGNLIFEKNLKEYIIVFFSKRDIQRKKVIFMIELTNSY